MCHPEVPLGQTTPEVIREEVEITLANGETLPALLARPDSLTGPAVLIIHDVFGRSPFYEGLAARLATAGYVALLPDCFFREGPLAERRLDLAIARRAQLDEANTVNDLQAALAYLSAHKDVRGSKIGTVGFCMGGTLVLDLSAMRDDLAGVCYYGFPQRLPNHSVKSAPAPLEMVDTMKGPLLGFWGDQDAGVGMHNVERLSQELSARQVDFEFTIYPGIGHGFLGASNLDPNHEAYQAACDSWTKTIEFYRQHLSD